MSEFFWVSIGMNLLIMNYMETLSAGGINKTVRELAHILSIHGHNVTVLQSNPMKMQSAEDINGYKIVRVMSHIEKYVYGFNPRLYQYLRNQLDNLKPDIIHIHGYHTLCSLGTILTLKVVMKINTPIVFTAHFDPLNHNTLAGKLFGNIYDKFVGRKLLEYCDYIISVSQFELGNLQKLSDLKNKCIIIPHGVDQINLRAESNIQMQSDIIKLLYVGYLLEYKGVKYIIEALNELVNNRKMRNIELMIIGEGECKIKLTKLAMRYKLNDNIIWKPFMPSRNVLDEMKRADIFLLLSSSEGYGIVVAEALSLGIPTIVTKGTALEEFTNETGCFGVELPPNPIIVADLILYIMQNKIQVGPFSDKIRTWVQIGEEYDKLFDNIKKSSQYSPSYDNACKMSLS